jgi:transcriptional regulator with XRE-family HTH domain
MNTKNISTLSLGERIRRRRKEKGLVLAELASDCNISSSFLSQIERDQASPSISTLHNIADAFGVPLAHFFSEQEDPEQHSRELTEKNDIGVRVVRANQRKILIYPGSGIKNELLSPDLNRAIQMMWVVIPPGAETGPEPLVHDGEECGLILQGQVKIWVGDDEYVLKQGDSIYQSSNIPHHSKNIGEEDVIIVVAITPPSF